MSSSERSLKPWQRTMTCGCCRGKGKIPTSATTIYEWCGLCQGRGYVFYVNA